MAGITRPPSISSYQAIVFVFMFSIISWFAEYTNVWGKRLNGRQPPIKLCIGYSITSDHVVMCCTDVCLLLFVVSCLLLARTQGTRGGGSSP